VLERGSDRLKRASERTAELCRPRWRILTCRVAGIIDAIETGSEIRPRRGLDGLTLYIGTRSQQLRTYLIRGATAAKSIFTLTVVSGASAPLSFKSCATMSANISMITSELFHDSARLTPFLAKSPYPRPSRCTSRLAERLNRKILTTSLSTPLLHT
jgi:hypothetical protein